MPLFFFQAEDGIRDFHVTGVQTCALPISSARISPTPSSSACLATAIAIEYETARSLVTDGYNMPASSSSSVTWCASAFDARSEERRVGKDGRSPWAPAL